MDNISIIGDNCTGCLLCKNVCPKNCISLKEDKCGYIYPNVESELCVNCGRCLRFCPEYTHIKRNKPLKAYASWGKDLNIREKSSSGALATIISAHFISNGGVVYGCYLDNTFICKHIRCLSTYDLDKIRGSKYVQSSIEHTFLEVYNDLELGKKVLFIGTPCQVAGILSFCKYHTNLYTIDLVCHGVPSVKIFKNSLPYKVKGESFDRISFRYNTHYHLSINDSCGKILYERSLEKDLFFKGFFTSLFNRKSCYKCQYASVQRVGDITLGDFWGIHRDEINTDVDKGVSLVLINNIRGNDIIEKILENIELVERPIEKALLGNKQLKRSAQKNFRYYLFNFLYPIFGFYISTLLSIPDKVIGGYIKYLLKYKL